MYKPAISVGVIANNMTIISPSPPWVIYSANMISPRPRLSEEISANEESKWCSELRLSAVNTALKSLIDLLRVLTLCWLSTWTASSRFSVALTWLMRLWACVVVYATKHSTNKIVLGKIFILYLVLCSHVKIVRTVLMISYLCTFILYACYNVCQ